MQVRDVVALLSLAGAALPLAGQDAPRPQPWRMAVAVDNDLFGGTDRYYTNGLKLAFATPDIPDGAPAPGVPAWLQSLARALSPARSPEDRRFASVFCGQEMYTPIDLWRTDPIVGDEPYAGFLYGGLGFHRRDGERMDALTLFAGLVGPASLAQAAQALVHSTFGFPPPLGWANQIRNEPVLGAAFDRKWRVLEAVSSARSGWEILGHAGGVLSNYATEAAGGFTVRAGWRLPADFGARGQRPGFDGADLVPPAAADGAGAPGGPALQAFASVDAHAVLRDIALDGNSFRDSLSVEREPIAADVTLGFALRWDRFELRYSYTYRTRRFVGERVPFVYGSLSAAFALGR